MCKGDSCRQNVRVEYRGHKSSLGVSKVDGKGNKGDVHRQGLSVPFANYFRIILAFQGILPSAAELSHPGPCFKVLSVMVVMEVKLRFESQGVVPSWASDFTHHLPSEPHVLFY